MRKYMVGDEYGNMWRGVEDKFYCNIGKICPTIRSANETMNWLECEYPRLENSLRIWKIELIEE